MSKPRAGYSTAEVMMPLLSPPLRQSRMHMKEGNLVMEDFDVAEDYFGSHCNYNP
jgi:hypothetical protein